KDSKVGWLYLSAAKEEHVAVAPKKDQTFCVEGVKNMVLKNYAVSIFPKLRTHRDSVVESLELSADREEHVAAVLAQEKTSCAWRVKRMTLSNYAVCVITKMTFHKDNIMADFVLVGQVECFSRILKEEDGSIGLGRIRRGGLDVPERIRRKLGYDLVGRARNRRFVGENGRRRSRRRMGETDEEEITTSDGETSWMDDEEESDEEEITTSDG
ncbi:MAG: uncharacterized protein A8A55_3362, partial [Amphiamblys sp. WSBS2006]